MGRSKRSPVLVRQADRRVQVVKLRKQGWTHDEIAAELGCSQSTVRGDLRAVSASMEELAADHMAALRLLQLSENHRVRETAWEMVESAREADDGAFYKAAPALQVVIRANERDAKLVGLDSPDQLEHVARAPMTDAEARAVLAKIGAIEAGAK